MCLCLDVCSFHDTVIVLVAMGMTAAICLSLTIFAIQTKVSSLSLGLYSVTPLTAAAIGQVSAGIRPYSTIKHVVGYYKRLNRDRSYHCGSQSFIFHILLLHVLSKHCGIFPIFAKYGTRVKCIAR